MLWLPPAVATGTGLTVTVVEALFTAQVPFVITARYEVVTVRFVAVNEALVFTIGVPAEEKLFNDDSHLTIVPV